MGTTYKLRRRELWSHWTTRMITGFAIGCWLFVLIGIMLITYDPPLLVGGLVQLVLGLVFGIPLTVMAYRRWREIFGIWRGVVVDDRGVDVYGEFVSWDELREVREDPDEGCILVYRPNNDESQPLCYLNLDYFPQFGQFLEQLRTRGVEIKVSHH